MVKIILVGLLLLLLFASGCDTLPEIGAPTTEVESSDLEERVVKLEEEVSNLSGSISELAGRIDMLPGVEVLRLDQVQAGLRFSTVALQVLEEAVNLAALSSKELTRNYNNGLGIVQLQPVILERHQRITEMINDQENIYIPAFAIEQRNGLMELLEMIFTHMEYLENLINNGEDLTLREKAQINALPSEYEKRAYDQAVDLRREILALKLFSQHEIESIESSQ